MKSRVASVLLAALVPLALSAQVLQPLVSRRAAPAAAAPAECAEGIGDAPAAPRIEAATLPLPPVSALAAPAARDLRSALETAQAALERNDRAAFDAQRERARALRADDPVLRIHDDAARLWDAQYSSPFFAEGSELHAALQRYSGYEAAVRNDVLTAGGARLYPAAESRRFLTRLAAQRLGQKSSTPAAPRAQPPRSPGPRERKKKAAADPAPAAPVVASSRATAPPAAGHRTASRRPPATTPVPTTTAATSPAETSSTSSTETSSASASLVDAPSTGTSPTDTSLTDTSATATPTGVDTSVTDSAFGTDTSATTATTAAANAERRSLMFPLILILIGVGVLILLFRTKA